jgi:hypothetical protein
VPRQQCIKNGTLVKGQFPDLAGGRLVFNRSVSLKDTWAKIEKAQHVE